MEGEDQEARLVPIKNLSQAHKYSLNAGENSYGTIPLIHRKESCTICAPPPAAASDSLDDENILEEIGGHFEGDMILSPEQSTAVKNGYTAVSDQNKWPNNIVYYTIDTAVFTPTQQGNIRYAMDQIELGSASSGCSSSLGYHGGQQRVQLQPNGCLGLGTIIHELLHTLGFVHMHTASDRDFYVDINYDAIQPGKESNFFMYNSSMVTDFGIPYDYDSVMHYGMVSFSKNGQPTIIPKKQNAIIGQRNGLSAKDIKRINHLYPNCY
uniref:Metalloendopeptidase n=1 Tax=Anopheles culicifacies TaxID=139723 RepID=A0A182LRL3_9DIPT